MTSLANLILEISDPADLEEWKIRDVKLIHKDFPGLEIGLDAILADGWTTRTILMEPEEPLEEEE